MTFKFEYSIIAGRPDPWPPLMIDIIAAVKGLTALQ